MLGRNTIPSFDAGSKEPSNGGPLPRPFGRLGCDWGLKRDCCRTTARSPEAEKAAIGIRLQALACVTSDLAQWQRRHRESIWTSNR